MPMTIYIYSKCSTCQAALKFLELHNIPYIKKEITETPPSISELEEMIQYKNGDVKKLFNTSGILYRDMQLTSKLPSLSIRETLQLLTTHGMLVKRPFVLGKNFGLTGFREVEWIKALT